MAKHTFFPCMRARMGDRAYYITTMSFLDVNKWIRPIDEIHERKDFKSWLQREPDPKRTETIAHYILSQEQHFFNALVVGIYRGNPDWFPVTFEKSSRTKSFLLDEDGEINAALGLLKLSGTEEIFAIDGQHRVAGIKAAVAQNQAVGNDQQCVIFVGHQTDEEGHKRTRRLFSTLNRYAKPVSRGEIVALSEDDAFAVVTRKLTEEYPYLKDGFTEFTKETNVPRGNKTCIVTVLGLYEAIRILAVPRTRAGSFERKRLEIGPSDDSVIQRLYVEQAEFWDSLRKHIPEIKEVTSRPASSMLAGKYRRVDGGHLLFRPVGLKPFARTLRLLLDRGLSLDAALRSLSKTVLNLESPPWAGVLWNPDKKTVITTNEALAQNLFLYMIGFDPVATKKEYDLQAEYQRALNDTQASLKDIPVVKGMKV